ncbi:hypothetical protein TNCT_580221 [Trichonephila clavata]|uniref:Uncharacterized protein n=1 Tax=Trichonephila clavata TaxID=2740835 RepID=A0A8X6LSG6_TRICU|nr:hypothetical protein TNCT_580221 [Trichonephila clavata]
MSQPPGPVRTPFLAASRSPDGSPRHFNAGVPNKIILLTFKVTLNPQRSATILCPKTLKHFLASPRGPIEHNFENSASKANRPPGFQKYTEWDFITSS